MTIRHHLFASRQHTDLRGTPASLKEPGSQDLVGYGACMPRPFEAINSILVAGPSPQTPGRTFGGQQFDAIAGSTAHADPWQQFSVR